MAHQETPDALWYTRCPVPTPLGIAGQLGWLDERFGRSGVAIKSVKDSADPEIMRSHYDHHLSWSFRQGGSVPPLWAKSTGRKTRLLGLTWIDEFQAVIALPGSGIETIADLAGRSFGLPRRSDSIVNFQRGSALKGLYSALEIGGVAPEEVELVDIVDDDPAGLVPVGSPRLHGLRRRLNYALEIKALHRGDVDAVFVKSAQGIVAANLLAAHIVSDFGFHPNPEIRINAGTPRVLTIDEEFLAKRPDMVVDLVIETLRAGRWARENRQALLRTISIESTVPEEAALTAFGENFHLGFDLTLDGDSLSALSFYKDFLLRHGILETDFNIDEWVAHEPLERALAQLGL